jgi:hypothetical protein
MLKLIKRVYYRVKFDLTLDKLSYKFGNDFVVGYIAARNGTSIKALIHDFSRISSLIDCDIASIIGGHALYHMHIEEGRYGKV